MKYKVLVLFVLLFGGHCFNLYRNSELTVPEVKTYEIKDEVTGEVYLLRKQPKLKKSIVYWVNWHVNQTPEYTYRVDSYKNYIERTWVEQHYGYRVAP